MIDLFQFFLKKIKVSNLPRKATFSVYSGPYLSVKQAHVCMLTTVYIEGTACFIINIILGFCFFKQSGRFMITQITLLRVRKQSA